MAVNLQKGQRVDLTKGNAGLSKIMVGLGWDEAKKSGGMLGGIFGSKDPQIDCDASVIMLNENGKIGRKEHLVYFGNLQSPCGSVKHSGDNLTGAGEGDDEMVYVELSKIPQDVHKLVFVVNIYDCIRRKQDFGMIKNAFIRIVNQNDKSEILKYNLTENYAGKTSLIVGEIYRNNAEWKFAAVGEGTTDPSLKDMVMKYN